MTTITALPTAPSRADPTTFSARGDAFLGALGTFVTETNTVAGEVNTNATTASTAATTSTTQAGIATAKAVLTAADRVQTGLDVTSTASNASAASASAIAASKLNLGNKTSAPTLDNQGSALLAGATYYDTTLNKWRVYSGSAWTDGISSVAGVSSVNGGSGAVTLKTVNGTALTGSGNIAIDTNGGATETSSAVSITLTSASTRLQAVTMTTADKAVTLPDATTLSTGGALFVIKNTGSLRFTVRNSISGLLAVLDIGQIAVFYLSNNTTSAGVWAIGNESVGSFLSAFNVGATTTINSVSTLYPSITTLSSTQLLVVYKDTTTNNLQACVLTVSGLTISIGTVLTVDSGTNTYEMVVTAMSATQAIVVYNANSGFVRACTLNVSGTTITAGTILSITANPINMSIAMLTITQAIFAHRDVSTGYGYAYTLNVSGTTLTAGAQLYIVSTLNYACIRRLTNTTAILAYQGVSAYATVIGLSVSGTAIIADAPVVVSAVGIGNITVSVLSSALALVISNVGMASVQAYLVNVSGTTLTIGAGSTLMSGGSSGLGFITSAPLSQTQVLVSFNPVNTLSTCLVNINGTSLSSSSILTSSSVSISTPMTMTAISSNKAALAIRGTSGFLQTILIETPL